MRKNNSYSRHAISSSIWQIIEEEVNEDVFPGKSEVVYSYARHHMKRFLDLIELIPPIFEGKILDIGIAYGFYDIALRKNYNLIISAVELPDNISSFCGMLKEYEINVKPCDLTKEKLPFDDESFEVVLFSEVIEHLRIHPIIPLKEIHRVLKTGGCLIITTPNVARLTNVFSLLFGKNIFEFFEDDSQNQRHVTDSWTHIREYTLEELKSLICESGLKIDKIKMSRCWNGFQRNTIKSNSRSRRFFALVDSIVTLFLQRYRSCIMIRARKRAR